jgi:hypothetical protein
MNPITLKVRILEKYFVDGVYKIQESSIYSEIRQEINATIEIDKSKIFEKSTYTRLFGNLIPGLVNGISRDLALYDDDLIMRLRLYLKLLFVSKVFSESRTRFNNIAFKDIYIGFEGFPFIKKENDLTISDAELKDIIDLIDENGLIRNFKNQFNNSSLEILIKEFFIDECRHVDYLKMANSDIFVEDDYYNIYWPGKDQAKKISKTVSEYCDTELYKDSLFLDSKRDKVKVLDVYSDFYLFYKISNIKR